MDEDDEMKNKIVKIISSYYLNRPPSQHVPQNKFNMQNDKAIKTKK